MLLQIGKKNKIYIYILIFILLTTINNLKLLNSNIFKFKVNNIIVSGLSEKNNLYIAQQIRKLPLRNIFSIKKEFFFKT